MIVNKEYIPSQIEVLTLELKDIVTNSLPWQKSGNEDYGDKMNTFWSNEK